jgi:hypothetical protein
MSYRDLAVAEILFRWDQFLSADFETFQPDATRLGELFERRYGFCRDRAKREAEYFLADFADRVRRATAA